MRHRHYSVAHAYGMAGLAADSRVVTQTAGSAAIAIAPLLAKISPAFGPAAPFVAAGGALVALIGGLFKPDLTKIEATNIVNRAAAQLDSMLAQWRALPASQKTESVRSAYLEAYDQAWAAVVRGCSNPALGQAGVACIADRERSGRWPWAAYYRDPVANDPDVIPDPVSASGSLFGSGDGGGVPTALLIGAGLLLAGALWN